MNATINWIPPDGVWPTMVTPFTASGEIDRDGLNALVAWYRDAGVVGLFAVCQSSEMFALSRTERVALARYCVEAADELPVVASGHVSDSIAEQCDELQEIAETGVSGLVFVSNRTAAEDESDDVWIERTAKVVESLPHSLPLGLYECPQPYKRLISEKTLDWMLATGRFGFVKDTSCDIEEIKRRLDRTSGTPLRLFNANTETLLASLRLGAAGYSGVMANFHPELYVRLCRDWNHSEFDADALSDYLTDTSKRKKHSYPMIAKEYLKRLGVPIEPFWRKDPAKLIFTSEEEEFIDRLRKDDEAWR